MSTADGFRSGISSPSATATAAVAMAGAVAAKTLATSSIGSQQPAAAANVHVRRTLNLVAAVCGSAYSAHPIPWLDGAVGRSRVALGCCSPAGSCCAAAVMSSSNQAVMASNEPYPLAAAAATPRAAFAAISRAPRRSSRLAVQRAVQRAGRPVAQQQASSLSILWTDSSRGMQH